MVFSTNFRSKSVLNCGEDLFCFFFGGGGSSIEFGESLKQNFWSKYQLSKFCFKLPLLWKQENISLPNNLNMAKNRLSSLKANLSKDPTLNDKYTVVINLYLSKRCAKQVKCDAQNEQSKIVKGPRSQIKSSKKVKKAQKKSSKKLKKAQKRSQTKAM